MHNYRSLRTPSAPRRSPRFTPIDRTVTRISAKMEGRFIAISRVRNWSEAELTGLLGSFGFRSVGDITHDRYEAICDTLNRGKF